MTSAYTGSSRFSRCTISLNRSASSARNISSPSVDHPRFGLGLGKVALGIGDDVERIGADPTRSPHNPKRGKRLRRAICGRNQLPNTHIVGRKSTAWLKTKSI
jgi:hypothetical protein